MHSPISIEHIIIIIMRSPVLAEPHIIPHPRISYSHYLIARLSLFSLQFVAIFLFLFFIMAHHETSTPFPSDGVELNTLDRSRAPSYRSEVHNEALPGYTPSVLSTRRITPPPSTRQPKTKLEAIRQVVERFPRVLGFFLLGFVIVVFIFAIVYVCTVLPLTFLIHCRVLSHLTMYIQSHLTDHLLGRHPCQGSQEWNLKL